MTQKKTGVPIGVPSRWCHMRTTLRVRLYSEVPNAAFNAFPVATTPQKALSSELALQRGAALLPFSSSENYAPKFKKPLSCRFPLGAISEHLRLAVLSFCYTLADGGAEAFGLCYARGWPRRPRSVGSR
jgi:hypothetical protein